MFTMGPPMWGAGASDQYFSNVILLMHFDGNYTDKSPLAQSFTNSGATTSTAGAKFTESANINGTNPNGGGPNIILADASRNEYDILNSDATFEAFVRLDSALINGGSSRIIVAMNNSSGGGSSSGGHVMSVQGDAGGAVLRYDFDSNGITTGSVAAYITIGTWTHAAVSRVGITTRMFIDGALVKTASLSGGGSAVAAPKRASVGNFWGVSSALHGAIDEVRVTKGVARYTASFTPPVAPFPDY